MMLNGMTVKKVISNARISLPLNKFSRAVIRNIYRDQYQYLGNYPATPPLTQQQSIDNKLGLMLWVLFICVLMAVGLSTEHDVEETCDPVDIQIGKQLRDTIMNNRTRNESTNKRINVNN